MLSSRILTVYGTADGTAQLKLKKHSQEKGVQFGGTVCQLRPASVLARACSFNSGGTRPRTASNIYYTKQNMLMLNNGKRARHALAGPSLPPKLA